MNHDTLAYSSPGKLVALLGDAAHPQSPFWGQGCNMAITDGYSCAMLLAQKESAQEAISAYDSEERHQQVNHVVAEARQQTDFCVSTNWFPCWFFRMLMKYSPLDGMPDELAKHDKSNMAVLAKLEGKRDAKTSEAKPSSLWALAVAGLVVVPVAMYFAYFYKE